MKTSLSEIEGQDTKLINLDAYKFIVSHGFSQMKMGNKIARNGRAFSYQRLGWDEGWQIRVRKKKNESFA